MKQAQIMTQDQTHQITDTVHRPRLAPVRRIAAIVALCALVATVTATWLSSAPAAAEKNPRAAAEAGQSAAAADEPAEAPKPKAAKKSKGKQALTGKLNLNSASAEQLMLLPGIGPSKAERVVAWRKKNGNFKRVADLRKVKGFGYKTVKKLEAYLDVKGENTLAAK